MEYIDGITLKEYLEKKGGKVAPEEGKKIMGRILTSLSVVHKAGIIHRDISPDNIMITSDGQGSLPIFSADGVFQGMGMGQSSCLLKEVRECVQRTNIPLEIAIKPITSNPAKILKLETKGHIAEGYDADFCFLTDDLVVDTVIAKGQVMVRKGEILVRGEFEPK